MKVVKPDFYDRFRCLAGACPDSCCHEWEVDVDSEAAARYLALVGPLGDRLRQVLKVSPDGYTMSIQNRRCPMWRQDGLCEIQAQLGHDALCQTCREFPRLRHDYGDYVELGLELSCPEAARLILTSPPAPFVVTEAPGGDEPEYDREAMEVLLATRESALDLLQDSRYTVSEALALLLIYGYHAQALLDGGDAPYFDPADSLQQARQLAKPADIAQMLRFFSNLEILTDTWKARLSAPQDAPWAEGYRNLARYGIQRYWLQAVSDYDLVCRVKFIVTSCLMVKILGGDLLPTAQCYSKEIENSAENMDALLDAAYESPAFTDDKLLWLLLNEI